MKELLRKDFPENFPGGNPGHYRFCKLLDKTETLVESDTRRLKGMKAKANLVSAAGVKLRFGPLEANERKHHATIRDANA